MPSSYEWRDTGVGQQEAAFLVVSLLAAELMCVICERCRWQLYTMFSVHCTVHVVLYSMYMYGDGRGVADVAHPGKFPLLHRQHGSTCTTALVHGD